MDPATAIAAAQAAFAIMNAFSSRGDGGLSANLQAIQEKLGVIVDGLVAIQKGITDLSDKIGHLEKDVDELPHRIYTFERLWDIQACAGTFVEKTGGPDRRGPRTTPPVTQDLVNCRRDLRSLRSQLSFTPPGRSALGAIAAMTAFAVEMALENLIEGPSGIPDILRTYVSWTDEIADPAKTGSAAEALKVLEQKLLADATGMLNRAGISGEGLLPLADQGTGRFSRTYCHQEWKEGREESIISYSHNMDIPNRIRPAIPERHGFTATVRVLRQVSYAVQSDIRQWRFETAELGAHTDPTRPTWWPDELAACDPGRDRFELNTPFSSSQAAADKRAADMVLGNERVTAVDVASWVEALNAEEAMAAFLRFALRTAATVNEEARRWLAVA